MLMITTISLDVPMEIQRLPWLYTSLSYSCRTTFRHTPRRIEPGVVESSRSSRCSPSLLDPESPQTRALLAWLAAVGVKMATLVLHATAAPAPFIPPKLVRGPSHDRGRTGRFRKHWSTELPPLNLGKPTPRGHLVWVALLESECCRSADPGTGVHVAWWPAARGRAVLLEAPGSRPASPDAAHRVQERTRDLSGDGCTRSMAGSSRRAGA